ncbi:NADH-quinone oxidoreductase subunit L [Escherichia coli]|uniref:NADH-quinone oxidoreductase subunit L n=1 Tax=Escherichia coli TaxID=562 RepID=A0A377BSP7_ECOLX|nr:NADH-quinone oxidoreductase subunit L [Escherichia coli]
MRCADEHACLTIILPLIGFVLLAFSRGRWSENVSAIVGVGSVGLAALVTAFIGVDFFANGEQSYSQPLWTWMSVATLTSVLTWCWTACR